MRMARYLNVSLEAVVGDPCAWIHTTSGSAAGLLLAAVTQ
jgi:hypothetical protein